MPSPLVDSSQPRKDCTQALEEKQHHKPGRPAERVSAPVLPSAVPPCPTTSPIQDGDGRPSVARGAHGSPDTLTPQGMDIHPPDSGLVMGKHVHSIKVCDFLSTVICN